MSNRFSNPHPQFVDTTGAPLANGSVGFYITSTSTLAAIYTDAANSNPAQNPMPLDARGASLTDIFLSPNIVYKWVLYDANSNPVDTRDPVVDPAANVTAAVQIYNGNPNGNVAGNAGTVGGASASMIWDSIDNILFICTTTGTSATAVWTAVASSLSGTVQLTGIISPSVLAATPQNDYNPTGFNAASIIRQDASIPVFITGLALGARGRVVIWENISTSNQVFQNQNALSLAANRFALGYDYVLPPGQSVVFWYDDTSAVWRLAGSPNSFPAGPPGHRLSLTTGTPVISADVTAQGTIYFTPYQHKYVNLPNGAGQWYTAATGELSQLLTDTTKSPAAAAATSAYDMFVWNDAGTLRCTRGPAWTSTTARGAGAGTTEIIRDTVASVWTNRFLITNGPTAGMGVYVGTILTNAGATVDWVANPAPAAGGGNARLGLWNMYNRVAVSVLSKEATGATWATTNATRAANASNSNRITAVFGLVEDAVDIQVAVTCAISSNGSTYTAAIGLNSTTTASGVATTNNGDAGASTMGWSSVARYPGLPTLGLCFFQWLEISTGTAGTVKIGTVGAGITGLVRA